MKVNRREIASMIDHTNLKAFATTYDFRVLCQEAIEYGFKSVAINTYPVKICSNLLEGSMVLTGAAVGFPLGQTTVESKVFEVKDAIENGAEEFDYVLNVGKVKEGDFEYIEQEMLALVEIGREFDVCSKVILETCYLSNSEIVEVCKIAKKIRPNFVKTSTGFGPEGATVDHVRLMKETVGEDVGVKAAGGIRNLETALAMIEAGATRLGTSSGISIIKELESE